MEKKLILRGLLAGAIAGVLAFIFARIFAEPVINQAISYQTGTKLLLWSVIGLVFAPMADRLLAPGPASAELRRTPEPTTV